MSPSSVFVHPELLLPAASGTAEPPQSAVFGLGGELKIRHCIVGPKKRREFE